jgi:hypothetical protein
MDGKHPAFPEPAYYCHATITAGPQTVPEIPCRVYLPDRVDGEIRVVLSPTVPQASQMEHLFEFQLSAEIARTSIESRTSYVLRSNRPSWGPYSPGTTIECEPRDLRIVHRLAGGDATPQQTRFTFWTTGNRALARGRIRNPLLDGSVEIQRGVPLRCLLQPNLEVTFDVHYHTAHVRDTFVQWTQPIIETASEVPAHDIDRTAAEILPVVDDVLLIASLAARHRTVCVGWTASDSSTLTTYYRRDVSPPEIQEAESNELVRRWLSQEFLDVAYAAFASLPDKQAVRRAIWAVVPGHFAVFDESYLALFAGLEDLVSAFRRQTDLRNIFRNSVWRTVLQRLEGIIDALGPLASAQQRAWMLEKLPELNSVPLRAAFAEFCRMHSTVTDDLWPLFEMANDGIGLAGIRNRLIHGQGYPIEQFGSLVIAKQHLRWTLERMLLALLTWPTEKSYVHPEQLARVFEPHLEWRSARANLTTALRT